MSEVTQNTLIRNSGSGRIGSAERLSMKMKLASATTARAASPRISAESQAKVAPPSDVASVTEASVIDRASAPHQSMTCFVRLPVGLKAVAKPMTARMPMGTLM